MYANSQRKQENKQQQKNPIKQQKQNQRQIVVMENPWGQWDPF